MRTVFKYEIPFDGHAMLALPLGAELLHFGNQREIPTLWAMVDPEQPPTKHVFRLAGTGHEIEEKIVKFIGTAQFAGGSLVFHLFEVLVDR